MVYIFFYKILCRRYPPNPQRFGKWGQFFVVKMKVMEFRTPLEGSGDQINAENGRT